MVLQWNPSETMVDSQQIQWIRQTLTGVAEGYRRGLAEKMPATGPAPQLYSPMPLENSFKLSKTQKHHEL